MNTTIVLTILMWTLIVAVFGFVIGQAFSDQSNRRRSASQEIRDQIPASARTHLCWITSSKGSWTSSTTSAPVSPLFQKASKTCPLNSTEINGRISASGLFHKVWVTEQRGQLTLP